MLHHKQYIVLAYLIEVNHRPEPLRRNSHAGNYDEDNLTDKKSAVYWAKYLKTNPTNFPKQHGVKISYQVVGGELCYTKAALKAFVRLMGSPNERKEANNAIRKMKVKRKRTLLNQ